MRTLTYLLLRSLIHAAPSDAMPVAVNTHAGLGQEQEQEQEQELDRGRSLAVDLAVPHVPA